MDVLSQLKDIKPIVKVDDYSLYLLIGAVIIFLIVFGVMVYKYITRIKKTPKPDPKKIALKKLRNLDFGDTKKVAYSFSTDGYMFVNDSNKADFLEIEKRLREYKYKKDTKPLPQDLQSEIKRFIKELR